MEWLETPVSGYDELALAFTMDCKVYRVCENGATLQVCSSGQLT